MKHLGQAYWRRFLYFSKVWLGKTIAHLHKNRKGLCSFNSILFVLLLISSPLSFASESEIEFIGEWSHGKAGPVTGDPERGLVFQSSGGVVLVLDGQLNKLSEFNTSGLIEDLKYDSLKLYVGTQKGVLILDTQDKKNISLLGEYPVPSSNLAVSGTTIFSEADYEVSILNAEDPKNIQLVSTIEDSQSVEKMYYLDTYLETDATGNFLYMLKCNWRDGSVFDVYDTSDISKPTLVSSVNSMDVKGFAVKGSNLFIADRGDDKSLKVYDIENIEKMSPLAEYRFDDSSSKTETSVIYLFNNTLYVDRSWGVVEILDISDIHNIKRKGIINSFWFNRKIYADGATAYLPNSWYGYLYSFDLTHNPVSYGLVSDFYIKDNLAYFNEGYYGKQNKLKIMDITDSNNVVQVAEFEEPYSFTGQNVASENYLVSLRYYYLDFRVFDISDPEKIELIGRYVDNEMTGWVNDVVINADTILCATDNGVFTFNISQDGEITPIGNYSEMGKVKRIYLVNETIAYITFSDAIRVFDISDPKDLEPIEASLPEMYYDFIVQEDQLLATIDNRVIIYDISLPDKPVEISSTELDYTPYRIWADSDFMYLESFDLARTTELYCYNIANPAVPKQITFYNEFHYRSFEIHNKKVYNYGNTGLEIFELPDPYTHQSTIPFEMPINTLSIGLKDSVLYASDSGPTNGDGNKRDDITYEIDISDPTNPVTIESYYTEDYSVFSSGQIEEVPSQINLLYGDISLTTVVNGDIANVVYATKEENENVYEDTFNLFVNVVDIKDTDNPIVVSTTSLKENVQINFGFGHGETNECAAGYNSIYVLSSENEIFVIDISDPTAPYLNNSIITNSPPEDIIISGSTLYIAELYYGISIYKDINELQPNINTPTFTTLQNSTLAEKLSSDNPSDDVIYQLVDTPKSGTIDFDEDQKGGFAYTPNADFFGSDSFTVKAAIGNLESSPATVTIEVNETQEEVDTNDQVEDEDIAITDQDNDTDTNNEEEEEEDSSCFISSMYGH